MPTQERVGKPAANRRSNPPNRSAEIVPFPATGSPRPTGGSGRLPTKMITRRGLNPEEIFHLAYRSLHADGAGWGCHPRKMAASVRSGYSRGVFQRTQRSLIGKGLMNRKQSNRKCPGRGRGYAVDKLTFENPETAYVVINRSLFDGSRTPKEIACFLHLKARGKRLAEPWHIERLMQASRPTVNALLTALSGTGLVENYATPECPEWGVAGCKNPTFNKTTRKKTTFKRTAHTRPLEPSRQSVPHTNVSQHKSEEQKVYRGTDQENASWAPPIKRLLAGTVAGLTMDARGEGSGPRPPMQMDGLDGPADLGAVKLSQVDYQTLARLGADPEDLFDRTMVAKQHLEKRGKTMGSVRHYMMQIAREDFRQANGVPIGVVEEIASGNQFQQEAARKDLASAWARQPAGKRAQPKAMDGRTPNGSALLDALKRGKA
jgi:hypothetical protein